MPTQNVNLTHQQLDRFVKEGVESGQFNDANEVHRAALAAMAKERGARGLRLVRLRQEIQRGLESGADVEVTDLDVFMDECLDEALIESRV